MPNYEDGKVYIIRNTITDDVYVGSTTQLLCNRMKNHRRNCIINNCTTKVYNMCRDIGMDNFYIELLEKYPCSSKEELNAREGQWIRHLKPSMNSNIAGRTQKVYCEDNKEYINQRKRNYMRQHRPEISIYNSKYRENHKESIA